MKDLRSLSLPNMKPSPSQSQYILTPGSERVEHGSLGRKDSIDLLVSLNPAQQDSSHYSSRAELITTGRRPVTGALFFLVTPLFSITSTGPLAPMMSLGNPFVTSPVTLPPVRRLPVCFWFFHLGLLLPAVRLSCTLASAAPLLIPPDRLQG